jgi:hypothetical protein
MALVMRLGVKGTLAPLRLMTNSNLAMLDPYP